MSLLRSKIATTVENISNVKDQRVLVNDAIEIALNRVYQHYDWPYYLDSKNGIITTIDDYTTGTLTATAASKTLTGNASTVWASAMVGRKIRIGSEKTFYRIAAVGGVNDITLDTAYIGDGGAGLTYAIYKDEYRLNANVDKYKTIRQMQNGVPMFDMTPTSFDKILPAPQNFADPVYNVLVGTNLDVYTTGTVTSSTSTLTGVSTAWTSVEGLGRGSQILIGSNVYTVKSVTSDTVLTTYEVMSNHAGATYEIKLNNLVVQVYQLPNAARILMYRYFRQPEPLVNDTDLPDMPYEFHWLLIYGALSIVWQHKGDKVNQVEAEQRFLNGLEMMKVKLGSFAPDRITARKSVDRLRKNYRAVENSNYDRKYSA